MWKHKGMSITLRLFDGEAVLPGAGVELHAALPGEAALPVEPAVLELPHIPATGGGES